MELSDLDAIDLQAGSAIQTPEELRKAYRSSRKDPGQLEAKEWDSVPFKMAGIVKRDLQLRLEAQLLGPPLLRQNSSVRRGCS